MKLRKINEFTIDSNVFDIVGGLAYQCMLEVERTDRADNKPRWVTFYFDGSEI